MLLNIEADAQRIVVVVTAFHMFLAVTLLVETFHYVSGLCKVSGGHQKSNKTQLNQEHLCS